MKRQPPPLDRMAALLDSSRTAKRDCRWLEWRNGHPAFCRRSGCEMTACAEPPRRHLPLCSYGQGIGQVGEGGKCSVRCQEIADVLTELERQPSLWRETA